MKQKNQKKIKELPSRKNAEGDEVNASIIDDNYLINSYKYFTKKIKELREIQASDELEEPCGYMDDEHGNSGFIYATDSIYEMNKIIRSLKKEIKKRNLQHRLKVQRLVRSSQRK